MFCEGIVRSDRRCMKSRRERKKGLIEAAGWFSRDRALTVCSFKKGNIGQTGKHRSGNLAFRLFPQLFLFQHAHCVLVFRQTEAYARYYAGRRKNQGLALNRPESQRTNERELGGACCELQNSAEKTGVRAGMIPPEINPGSRSRPKEHIVLARSLFRSEIAG